MSQVNWLNLLKPEEMAAYRERLQKLRYEFTTIYGLAFTEGRIGAGLGDPGRRQAKLDYECYRIDVEDHGPLSYWFLQEIQPDGSKKQIGGGDAICYEVARIEAAEKLIELLNKRADLAAEALKSPPPGPVGGASGATAWPGKTTP